MAYVRPYLMPATCANPLCEVRYDHYGRYCCWACQNAHEHHYEIHEDGLLGHSEECQRDRVVD